MSVCPKKIWWKSKCWSKNSFIKNVGQKYLVKIIMVEKDLVTKQKFGPNGIVIKEILLQKKKNSLAGPCKLPAIP